MNKKNTKIQAETINVEENQHIINIIDKIKKVVHDAVNESIKANQEIQKSK